MSAEGLPSTLEVEQRAQMLIELGRCDEAISLIGEAVARQPSSRLWCLLSLAYLRQGSGEESLRSAEAAILINPDDEWGHRLRGWALLSLHRKHEAVESVKRSLKIDPHHAYVWADFGHIASRAGLLGPAKMAIARAVALEPENLGALRSASYIFTQAGDWDHGKEFAETLLRLAPDNPAGLVALGWNHQVRGEFPSAIACYRRVLEIEPDSTIAVANLHDSLVEMERHDEVVELFERMVQITPDDPDAWASLASGYLNAGDWRRAVESANRALALDETTEFAYRICAKALWALGEEDEALVVARRGTERGVARFMPSRSWITRANIARRMRIFDEAETCIDRARSLPEGEAMAAVAEAHLAWICGDTERAERAAENAVAHDPKHVISANAAGYAALSREAWDEAVDWFDLALKRRDTCCARAGLTFGRLMSGDDGVNVDGELRRIGSLAYNCRCELLSRISEFEHRAP